MRKLFLLVLALLFASASVFAQTLKSSSGKAVVSSSGTSLTVGKSFSLKGTIIDNACAQANKNDLANFIKKHTKECVLAPKCSASGYSIYSDGKLYKFDKQSNVKIAEFLNKKDSKIEVLVTVNKAGKEFSLISIESQK